MTHTPLRVFYLPAAGTPEFLELLDSAQLEEQAGSYLDVVPLSNDIVMFCDRDEREASPGYSFTVDGHYVHGDAFFVRQRDSRFLSLADEDLETILSLHT